MADEDDASKTEDPSDKKLSKAREKGDWAISQDVKSWGVLIGATAMVIAVFPWMARSTETMLVKFIEQPHAMSTEPEALRAMLVDVLLDMVLILAPFMLTMIVVALAFSLVQTGLMWSPSKLELNFKAMNPLNGFKKIFSVKAVLEMVKGIIKMAIVSVMAYWLIWPLYKDITLVPGMEIMETLARTREAAIRLLVGTVVVLSALAAADYAYQRFTFMKKMRMSKQDLKDEHKQAEGDPQVKARIRQLRVERARQRMMANVPTADVVVTNPTHYAVALTYKIEDMEAPKLVAKGVDEVALRIREVAEENEVPLVENPALAQALYATVELDQEIPPEHYKAVAEVISYVMKLKGTMPGGVSSYAGVKP